MTTPRHGIGPHGLRPGDVQDALSLGGDLDRLEAVRRRLNDAHAAATQAIGLSRDARAEDILARLRDGAEDLLADLEPVIEALDDDYRALT